MNEETIEYRLTQIEKKVDTITDLLLQTQAQELRLATAEKAITDLKNELEDAKKQKDKNKDRWLNPLISTIVSAVVAAIMGLILIKIGLK